MKEVPLFLVKANQWVLLLGTGLAILLQNTWIITSLFVVMLLPLLFGAKNHLVFWAARKLFPSKVNSTQTQAAELLRFNQSIATLLLGASSVVLWISGHWSGYLLAGLVTVAAGVALAGFCIGCFFYYQWKQIRYKVNQ